MSYSASKYQVINLYSVLNNRIMCPYPILNDRMNGESVTKQHWDLIISLFGVKYFIFMREKIILINERLVGETY